jgi:hypothetical protein
MIELAENRKIVIHRGLSVTVSHISKAAWLECFDAMTASQSRKGQGVELHVEAEDALIGLLEKVAIDAEGYPHLADIPDWQSKIPRSHRLAYGNALGSACVLEDKGSGVYRRGDDKVVRLQALWSACESGLMRRHKDLVHVFKVPSAAQLNNFRRGFAAPRIVSGGRLGRGSGLTVQGPLAARMCSAIYDEFVVRVEGYTFNGVPLYDNRAAIVNCMDTYHKVIAAGLLTVG